MKNYGELHNEMVVTIMNRVEISSDMTKEEKKEICLQGFIDVYGRDNLEIFTQGLNFESPFEVIDSVKEKMSSELYTFLTRDIDYLLKNDNVDYEDFFNRRFAEAKLDDRELQLYKDCSSILISSVQLWSSEEGNRYIDALDTTEVAAKRPPTREQVVGYIGVQDWVGGLMGGLVGGPIGVAVGAVGTSLGATISHAFYSQYN